MHIATLLFLAATTFPPTAVTKPAQPVEIVVIGPASKPVSGVTITLVRATRLEEGTKPLCVVITNHSGTATIKTPDPGTYMLRLELSGFLTTTLGPFRVCPADQVACGPSLVTPTTVLLPEAAFVD